ncbi:hypothetical protein M2272_005404 [Mycobacterium frederiksbergense]|uniref:General secretion pathway protein GspK n=1 Tax=Mycolicibacterium frederiksbergense TaxID=117567 RepID=A0ABT6L751_9MYCO|nr:hypothetical protein [Mycolicibacterium frederiksbergense]MDH6198744.1 hypothetical protein [Mycolicibacterium frederiksbergense]
MYLSAERLAVANQAVHETFARTSVAWQALPHWDTGDPGQARVRNDIPNNPGFLNVDLQHTDFQVTVVQANAPTPDPLLAEVMAQTVTLAGVVDDDVLPKLYAANAPGTEATVTPDGLLDALIGARAAVEKAGYRSPSCLFTNTAGLKKLSQLVSGCSILAPLLDAANINTLHRAEKLDPQDKKARLVLLGRRQRIAQGCAAEASPGEEPVDLAVSVAPSLEVVGETAAGEIELTVRIRYALRIKDANGLSAAWEK